MGVNCIDYSTLAVSSTAVDFKDDASPTIPAAAKGALITVETDSVRYREDGTAPTDSEGTLLYAADVLKYDSWTQGVNWRSVLLKVQFIRVTSDAALKIHWYD